MHYFSTIYCIGRSFCILWNSFTILSFLYRIEFYLQNILQFNDSVHIYNLVILPIFKIPVGKIPIAVNTVLTLRRLMSYIYMTLVA